jgi:tetraacyldisaccharide 4'-kinase
MTDWLQKQWLHNSPWQLLLRPLSWIFHLLAVLRRLAYHFGIFETSKVRVPVIVVGNISVGGTGKTPLVIALVELLRAQGFHPGIVSRGYLPASARRRAPAGVRRIYPDIDPVMIVPDEPAMLVARLQCPMFAGRDRVAAAQALLNLNEGVDIIVADDGLQHYPLARDIEIAVIDAARAFGNRALLPAGPLREPVPRLASVAAVVVNGGNEEDFQFGPPAFAMRLGNERFVRLDGPETLTVEDFVRLAHNRNIHVAAGIGHPERFFAHLGRLGIKAALHAFPDHHPFRAQDFDFFGAEIILMTEKDAVKCRAFADARMWFMRVDALLPESFAAHILTLLGKS